MFKNLSILDILVFYYDFVIYENVFSGVPCRSAFLEECQPFEGSAGKRSIRRFLWSTVPPKVSFRFPRFFLGPSRSNSRPGSTRGPTRWTRARSRTSRPGSSSRRGGGCWKLNVAGP